MLVTGIARSASSQRDLLIVGYLTFFITPFRNLPFYMSRDQTTGGVTIAKLVDEDFLAGVGSILNIIKADLQLRNRWYASAGDDRNVVDTGSSV